MHGYEPFAWYVWQEGKWMLNRFYPAKLTE